MERSIVIDSSIAESTELLVREDKSQHLKLTAAQRAYLPLKRLLSIVLSLAGLVIAIPLFLAVAVAIKLDSKGPVFYNQMRVGKNGKPFLMYKFRSMIHNADKQFDELYEKNDLEGTAFKIKNDPRITKVGRWIRKASIDELPQLVNILLGQMTIVGPRPLVKFEYEACSPIQKIRFSLTPGLTCYWQINGRNNITSFDERIRLDMEYIEDMGPMTDLIIFIKTVPVVITGNGAY